MLTLIILVAVAGILFYHYCIVKPYRYWIERGVKQGKPKWLFGDNWLNLLRIQSTAEMVITIYNQGAGTRKWPIPLASDRVCRKPYTIQPASPEERPVHIEEGTAIILPLIGIHRDPQYYPDPD
ncbi:hypothetical protein NQ315_004453, partial [Exocentrus adspersus]